MTCSVPDGASGERTRAFDAVGRRSQPGRGLPPRTRCVVVAYAEAAFAREGHGGTIVPANTLLCERAATWLDASVRSAAAGLRRDFALLALLLEFLPFVVMGAASRMSRLPIGLRVRYLATLKRNRIRLLSMLGMAFEIPMSIVFHGDGEEKAQPNPPSNHGRAR
ncbi:MAG TPA: hypothetical protein VM694_34705 [Polyangium sp.]|jgi:hypothetical protein|nr:hypothetical protein [Polyangium sp.]